MLLLLLYLFFKLTLETGSYCVAQAGLELLALSDTPISASQSAQIIGVSHYSWPYTKALWKSFQLIASAGTFDTLSGHLFYESTRATIAKYHRIGR